MRRLVRWLVRLVLVLVLVMLALLAGWLVVASYFTPGLL